MERELRRNEQEGVIGGVCAGIGEYLSVDKTWIRALFVLSIFFSAIGIGLIGPIAYIVIWIVVPRKPYVFPNLGSDFYDADYRVDNENRGYNTSGVQYEKIQQSKKQQRRSAGLILLCIGVFLLIIQLDFISWRTIFNYWPMVFVVAGLYTVFTSFPREKEWRKPNSDETEGNAPSADEDSLKDNYSDNQNH